MINTLSTNKPILAALLALALAGQGCTNYHTVHIGKAEDKVPEVNAKSRKKTVILDLFSDEEYFGSVLEFRADSTVFLRNSLERFVEYPNSEIRDITIIDRKGGGFAGLKVGSAIGCLAEAFVFYLGESIYDDPDKDWPEMVQFCLIGGGIGGFVFGLPIGWIHGKRDVYEIKHQDGTDRHTGVTLTR